jgi:hypothetical protein
MPELSSKDLIIKKLIFSNWNSFEIEGTDSVIFKLPYGGSILTYTAPFDSPLSDVLDFFYEKVVDLTSFNKVRINK